MPIPPRTMTRFSILLGECTVRVSGEPCASSADAVPRTAMNTVMDLDFMAVLLVRNVFDVVVIGTGFNQKSERLQCFRRSGCEGTLNCEQQLLIGVKPGLWRHGLSPWT